MSFDAYGRRFDLQLERNDRLLSQLPAQQKRALSAYEVYKGKLAGLPGSWVRMLRVGSELRAAIWDGTDLYSISPARDALRFAVGPIDATGSTPVIHRLSDTEFHLSFLGDAKAIPPGKSKGAAQYEALRKELRSSAALAATGIPSRQIELAAVGDFEFFSAYGSSTQAEMLARLNIVDGIFGDQVDVAIVVSQVIVFNTATDPFTAGTSEDLLDEFATYRQATPAVRDPGLAHLFTGRQLEGDIIGIAYLDGLCDPFFGSGLSTTDSTTEISALVVAHELGHNFGAPHDAEPGSACAATPPTFLMNPFLNGSSTFSQCSLAQMAPVIAAASCMTPSHVGDARVDVTPTTIQAFTGEAVLIPIDVTSVGTAAVNNVVVTSEFSDPLQIDSVSVVGGTCTTGAGNFSCDLGSMDPGTTKRVELRLIFNQPRSFFGNIEITGSNDRVAGNNTAPVEIQVSAATDVTVIMSPPQQSGFTRQALNFTATVSAFGVQPAADVVARVTAGGLDLNAVTVDVGVCTPDASGVTCVLNTMPPGSTRKIQVQGSAALAGNGNVHVEVTSSNDEIAGNNAADGQVLIAASRDVKIRDLNTSTLVALNKSTVVTATVVAGGIEAIHNVRFNLLGPGSITLESVAASGGTCIIDSPGGGGAGGSPSAHCDFGTLNPGDTRPIQMQVRGAQICNCGLSVQVLSPEDEDSISNGGQIFVLVQYPNDVYVQGMSGQMWAEGTPFTEELQLGSTGVDPVHNISVTGSIPSGLTVTGAALPGGICTVAGDSFTCSLNSLSRGMIATVTLNLVGTAPGDYTVAFAVSASDDANPGNNSAGVAIHILPLTDLGISSVPQGLSGEPGELLTVPVTLLVGPRPIAQGSFTVTAFGIPDLTIEAVNAPGTNCTLVATVFIQCLFGALAANTTVPVEIQLRSTTAGLFSLELAAGASPDLNASNNQAILTVRFEPAGDAALTVGATSISATVDQEFQFPRVRIVASELVNEAVLQVTLPASVRLQSISPNGADLPHGCTPSTGTFTCAFDTIAAGATIDLDFMLRGTQPATFTSNVTLTGRNDRNTANNARSVSVTINSATPPPPPPSGGGGGGGSLGVLSLGVLTLLMRRRICLAQHRSRS